MIIGEIVLIPFPFSEFSQTKMRLAVVIAETRDKYKDLVVSAISSVIPVKLSEREIIVPAGANNNLRVNSVIKVDRIVTIKREKVKAALGQLTENELKKFKTVLAEMVR